MNTIRRSDAIDALIKEYPYINPTSITDVIMRVEDAEPQQWISVTEKLPEKEGCYLVTVKNDHKRKYSKTAWYSGDGWFARQDIIAWCELPEPYQEVEHDG